MAGVLLAGRSSQHTRTHHAPSSPSVFVPSRVEFRQLRSTLSRTYSQPLQAVTARTSGNFDNAPQSKTAEQTFPAPHPGLTTVTRVRGNNGRSESIPESTDTATLTRSISPWIKQRRHGLCTGLSCLSMERTHERRSLESTEDGELMPVAVAIHCPKGWASASMSCQHRDFIFFFICRSHSGNLFHLVFSRPLWWGRSDVARQNCIQGE